ncbi:unnamed protein product [Sphagnum balticum]
MATKSLYAQIKEEELEALSIGKYNNETFTTELHGGIIRFVYKPTGDANLETVCKQLGFSQYGPTQSIYRSVEVKEWYIKENIFGAKIVEEFFTPLKKLHDQLSKIGAKDKIVGYAIPPEALDEETKRHRDEKGIVGYSIEYGDNPKNRSYIVVANSSLYGVGETVYGGKGIFVSIGIQDKQAWFIHNEVEGKVWEEKEVLIDVSDAAWKGYQNSDIVATGKDGSRGIKIKKDEFERHSASRKADIFTLDGLTFRKYDDTHYLQSDKPATATQTRYLDVLKYFDEMAKAEVVKESDTNNGHFITYKVNNKTYTQGNPTRIETLKNHLPHGCVITGYKVQHPDNETDGGIAIHEMLSGPQNGH